MRPHGWEGIFLETFGSFSSNNIIVLPDSRSTSANGIVPQ